MMTQTHRVSGMAMMDLPAAQALLENPQVRWVSPSLFVNASQLDAIVTVFVDSQLRPLQGVRMSLPLAKTYATALVDLIAQYERETGQTVPTFDEIQAKIMESRTPSAEAGS